MSTANQQSVNPSELEVFTRNGLKAAVAWSHSAQVAAGWWTDIETGKMVVLERGGIARAMRART